MDGRVATFAVTLPGLTPEQAATRLAERDIAVWHGDYYAVEVMKRLGLAERSRPSRDHPLQHRRGSRSSPRRPRRAALGRLMLRLYWARNDGLGGHVFLGLEDIEQLLEEMAAQGMSGWLQLDRLEPGTVVARSGRLRPVAGLTGDEGARRREAVARLARLPGRRGRERRRRRPVTGQAPPRVLGRWQDASTRPGGKP